MESCKKPEQESYHWKKLEKDLWIHRQPWTDERKVREIAREVSKWETDNEINAIDQVREWVEHSTGEFSVNDVYRSIQLCTPPENRQRYISLILRRLRDEGVIERVGKRHGVYCKINTECREIKWWEATGKPLDLIWPLGIEEMAKTYSGNIIIIAGQSNYGKTSFILSTAVLNMDKHKIDIFSNEMDKEEFGPRIRRIRDLDEEQFKTKVKVYERYADYHQAINPDHINIVDYLTDEEAFKVKFRIEDIAKRLKKGIAIICLQKHQHKEFGYGGEGTKERARLYITINPGVMILTKVKNRVSWDNDPNGKQMYFDLNSYFEFKPKGVWHHLSDEQDAINARKRAWR